MKQREYIDAYFDYIGAAFDQITAFENQHEVIFIITFSKCELLNLKPKTEIHEIKLFFNSCRIIFKKNIGHEK